MTVVARVGPGGEVNGLVTFGREIETPSRPLGTRRSCTTSSPACPAGRSSTTASASRSARAARDGRRVAVILADVDAMKDINDSFGHAVGDDVLRGLARAMSSGVRTGDTVARFGGDEFVVLVDGLDESDTAWQFAERLQRRGVPGARSKRRAGALVVTASFGLAVGTPIDSPAELLQRADAAMYRAKAMGGGKVVVFEDGAEVSITTLADELAVAVSHGLIRAARATGRRPRHGTCSSGTRGSLVGNIPSAGSSKPEQFVDVVANTPILPVVDLAVLRRTAAAAARTGPLRPARARLRAPVPPADRRRRPRALPHRRSSTTSGIAPSDLCVEIAHALIARPSATVERALRDLRETGVRTVLSAVDGECEVNEIVEYGFDELRLAAAPRPRRRTRPDPPARRARHHRARPRARSHRDRGRHRDRRRTRRHARCRMRLRPGKPLRIRPTRRRDRLAPSFTEAERAVSLSWRSVRPVRLRISAWRSASSLARNTWRSSHPWPTGNGI